MRTSKATFIPGRTIFSLETLVKLVESILAIEFSICTLQDFEENGDPDGFAYRKGRSVLSCMAITLTAIEQAPREEMLDCILVTADLKKAFNTTNRSTVVAEAQRIAGAGRIMMTRWDMRNYTFEKQIRGLNHTQGTDAGAYLSIWGFDRWISTDKATQKITSDANQRPVIMEPCNFSDDRNINSRGSDVENGRFQQEVLNGMMKWATEQDAKFHTVGPKQPYVLIFSQVVEGVQSRKPTEIDNLKFFGTTIQKFFSQKIVGPVSYTHLTLPTNREV